MKKAHKFQIVKKSDKMKQTISQKVDSGRSMTEMLGVLAVIGVLSVASILGYRYAMAKWRANETVNELNIRAYDIATRFDKLVASNTREIEMEMGDTTKLGYPITARISPQYVDYFEMFVSNVPTDVCKELLNSQWQAPYSIFVGVEEYEASSDICEQAENVQLAYEFYKDLSTREEVPEETRHKIQRCNHDNNCQCGTCNEEIGLCESECEKDQVCLKRYDDSRWMKCCNKEDKLGNFCCVSIENGNCCNYEGNCCPPDKPLIDKNGNCYSCDEENPVNVENVTYNCYICANREVNGSVCQLKKCPKERPLKSKSGYCYSCDYNGVIEMVDTTSCESICAGKRILNNTFHKRCIQCGVPNTPYADKPIWDWMGNCYACSDNSNITGGAEDIAKAATKAHCQKACKDTSYPRIAIEDGHYCAPDKCASFDPANSFHSKEGECYSCDIIQAVSIDKNNNDCSVCGNKREVVGSVCQLKTCPTAKPLRDKNGTCYSCDYNGIIEMADTTSCESICAGKRILNNTFHKRCIQCGVPNTPYADKPIWDWTGNCYACSDNRNITGGAEDIAKAATKAHCQKACKDTPYPRITIENGHYCVRDNCQAGYFEGSDKDCYNCKITVPIPVENQEKCEVCMNRKYQDGYCVDTN